MGTASIKISNRKEQGKRRGKNPVKWEKTHLGESESPISTVTIVSRGRYLVSGIEIAVGNWNILVEVVPWLHKNENLYGDWDKSNRKIRIAGDICPQEQASTLLHELYHAASDYSYLRFNEQTVVALENFWVNLFASNPEVILTTLNLLKEDFSGPRESTQPDA